MKYLIIGLLLFLSACQQLMHGQQQPVIYKNAKEKILFTTCSGTVEYWGSCFDKAKNSCSKGYMILDKKESAISGARELTFKCN